MKIKFRQSGGMAGLTQGCEIDTQALPATEAAEIKNLVKNTGVLKSQSPLRRLVVRDALVACDIFYYSISVESHEITYLVRFSDFTIPENGRLLLDYLKKQARPQAL